MAKQVMKCAFALLVLVPASQVVAQQTVQPDAPMRFCLRSTEGENHKVCFTGGRAAEMSPETDAEQQRLRTELQRRAEQARSAWQRRQQDLN